MAHIDPLTLRDMLRNSLAKGQHPRLTVTSNSMAPLFEVGDQVILEAIQFEQLQTGDIVTLVDEASLLTHRIWAIQETAVLTKGDHALIFDKPAPQSTILGRVIGRTHKQRTLSFQNGPGQWLDQYLTNLVRREYRWLTGTENELGSINSRILFIHRLFFMWAIIITSIISLATRIKSGETKI
jgi:signal peptidase I